MAIIFCARRKSDGLLTWPHLAPRYPADISNASPQFVQNAIQRFGGVAEDWHGVFWDTSNAAALAEAQAVRDNIPGRSFMDTSFDENGTEIGPRSFTFKAAPSLTSDVETIEDDGVDSALATFDVGDPLYVGTVSWIITEPDGAIAIINETAVAGIATLTVTTLLTGTITIEARAEDHGDAIITIEGV